MSDLTPAVAQALTPTQLAGLVNRALRELGSGWVEGEVTDVRVPGSGHVYFRLRDDQSKLNCVIWKGRRQALRVLPEEGRLVRCRYERVDYHGGFASLSLIVDACEPTGEGELIRRAREILARLERDGLTSAEAKPALPRLPRRIGLITGVGADAYHDVVGAVCDRWPPARILHCACRVEGVGSAAEVIDALSTLRDQPEVDVIVIARGGGSVESLFGFNDEGLCRAIAAVQAEGVAVVTAVGHTADRTNCDHVAARFADVPRAVAELIVPSWEEELGRLAGVQEALRRVESGIEAGAARLLRDARIIAQRADQIEVRRTALDARAARLAAGGARRADRARARIGESEHALALALGAIPGREVLAPALQRLDDALARTGRDGAAARALLERRALRLRAALDGASAAIREARGAGALLERAQAAMSQRLHGEVDAARRLLTALDVRERGFALVRRPDGSLVTRAAELAPGDELAIGFADGVAAATVDAVVADPTREGAR